jgi:hypothetical protein
MTDVTDQTPTATPPILCDMTDAPDTAVERLAEYERTLAPPDRSRAFRRREGRT